MEEKKSEKETSGSCLLTGSIIGFVLLAIFSAVANFISNVCLGSCPPLDPSNPRYVFKEIMALILVFLFMVDIICVIIGVIKTRKTKNQLKK